MSRRGRVYFDDELVGTIVETEEGMSFEYDEAWLRDPSRPPISPTLPRQESPHRSRGPSPFFMGLLPEGWLHELTLDKLRIAPDDWFGQILELCRDCVGAVHIEPCDE